MYRPTVFYRKVSPSDMQLTERRLMQTMDMIIAKKKRIALSKAKLRSGTLQDSRQGWWGRILTATAMGGRDFESILLYRV